MAAVANDRVWVEKSRSAVLSGFLNAVLVWVLELSTILLGSHNFGLEHT